MTESRAKPEIVDNLHAPETYACEIVGYSLTSGNVTLTLASNRAFFTNAGYENKRVVVGRIVLSLASAQSLSFELYDFLKKNGLSPARKPNDVALQ
jgi:hypothetical protein